MNRKKELLNLVLGTLGAFVSLFFVIVFNSLVLPHIPLAIRMVVMIVVYGAMGLIPMIIIVVGKEKVFDYICTKEKLFTQVLIGIIIGAILSLLLTLVPHLAGFGQYVSSGKNYKYAWQFAYEFVYCILAVGFAEEFIFRGFVFEKTKKVLEKDAWALVVSSLLFGAFHMFGGSIVQMIMTAFMGAFFCLCKIKIKNCSILSLIIAHGIYDAMISLWEFIFTL